MLKKNIMKIIKILLFKYIMLKKNIMKIIQILGFDTGFTPLKI